MSLSRRQVRAALTGAAASAAYLAISELGARRLKLGGLVMLAVTAAVGDFALYRNPVSKAAITEARLNNMINNGFSVGGPVTIQGMHNAAGGLKISGTTLTLNHGGVTAPGGAPGSYTPAYESSLSQCIADINTKLSAANIF